MAYADAVAELYALGHELGAGAPRKFDLAHMRALTAAMGHPERRFASVLIAGTNGKGSTSATLAGILQSAHLRTGLYTSPHLLRVNERIRLNGEPISDVEFAEIYDRVERAASRLLSSGGLPWHPSFFEMLTAMAFEFFASVGAEIAVLEVGMGGRLDATNVAEPCISVITDISLDHQNYLGSTISEIAREKAGIIRANGTLVTLPQHPQANDVIGNVALELNARPVSAVPYVPPVSPHAAPFYNGNGTRANAQDDSAPRLSYPLQVMGREITVETVLVGRHQLRNIALAIATAIELNGCGFSISPAQIASGIRNTRWPGRFQVLHPDPAGPLFILDVAHNPAGAWALRSTLSEYFGEQPLIFVFGAMRDKAIAEMAEILFPLANEVIATRAGNNPRAASPEEIIAFAARTGTEVSAAASVAEALSLATRSSASLRGASAVAAPVVVVTGSIYIVGEALELLTAARSAVCG